MKRGASVIGRVQQNLTGYFRRFRGLPGVTFEDGRITWIASEVYLGNLVLGCKVPPGEADDEIDKVLIQVGITSESIDWFVFPACSPENLGEKLIQAGERGGPNGAWRLIGRIGGPGGTWMVLSLSELRKSPPTPSDYTIHQVIDMDLLETWRDINSDGFGGGDYQIFFDAFAREGFGTNGVATHYIGYHINKPVTSATLILEGGIASVFNESTPEPFRRRGFGGAVTHYALREARNLGYRDAYVWSSPLDKGAYVRLGFVQTDLGIREYQFSSQDA